MRLLLGHGVEAYLLVDANCKEVTDKFKFRAINGEWDGTFDNGTVIGRDNWGYETSTATDVQILCSDQELLSGDYNDVIHDYNNGISSNGLKTYEEFASVYTKNVTNVPVSSLDEFYELYSDDEATVTNLISFLSSIVSKYPDKELLFNWSWNGETDDILVSYDSEESDEKFNARIRKAYDVYVAQQNQMSKCITVIKTAETTKEKIKALEAEIERLKQLEKE